jgi:hypothetical protein
MEDKSKTTSKQTTSAEGWMLKNGIVGQTFFTEKNDKSMTAFAKYYKRKVKTERIIAVTGDKLKPTAYSLTKVTLI